MWSPHATSQRAPSGQVRFVKLQGYDKLALEDRRKLTRDLIDKGAKVTPEEETELSVLLLMGLNLSEVQARDEVDLRARQAAQRKEYKIR